MPEAMILLLPGDLRRELEKIAREKDTSAAELATTAIRRFVHAQALPRPPRYARRLGPIVDM